MNMNSASLYSAAGAEKAAAAQRAADVRKKLLKSASDIEGASSPEEAFMIGQWTDSRHSQVKALTSTTPAPPAKSRLRMRRITRNTRRVRLRRQLDRPGSL